MSVGSGLVESQCKVGNRHDVCEVALMRVLRLCLEGGQVQAPYLQVTPMEGLGTRWRGRGGFQVREDYYLSSRRVHVQRSRVLRESAVVPELGHRGHRLEWPGLCVCRQNQTHLLLGDGGKASGWGW